MKITALNIEMAPQEVKEKITGFIEFDQSLDQELRKGHNQHPSHYQLKWRSSTPRAIKTFINRQLQDFGHKKMGIGEDRRSRQKRNQDNAELEAMNMLMRYAHDLSLIGTTARSGPIPPPPPPPPEPVSHKKIGVSMSVQFPDESKQPRVDWGDEIRVAALCFNKTESDITGKFVIQVLQADTVIEKLTNVNIDLPADSIGSRTVQINNNDAFVIKLDKTQYKNTGEYRIHATLINSDSGERVDVVKRKFWLAENPPRRFPFNLRPVSLEGDHAWLPDISNSPAILYNTNHPHYKYCQDDDQEQANYLFNICLEGALHFIITRPLDEGEKPDYTPLNTEVIVGADATDLPSIVYNEIRLYFAKVRWRIYED